jgi:hypothetical protein
MQAPLTEDQAEYLETVRDYVCSTGKAAKKTGASEATRELLGELGAANGPVIFATQLNAEIRRTVESDARSIPGIQWLKTGVHEVKQNFWSALHKRWVRERVTLPFFQFMFRITDPWAYIRSVMTDDDIEQLRADFGGGALGFDALDNIKEERLVRLTHQLQTDGDFGRFVVDAIERGIDIFGLNHPALQGPLPARRRARGVVAPPPNNHQPDDDNDEDDVPPPPAPMEIDDDQERINQNYLEDLQTREFRDSSRKKKETRVPKKPVAVLKPKSKAGKAPKRDKKHRVNPIRTVVKKPVVVEEGDEDDAFLRRVDYGENLVEGFMEGEEDDDDRDFVADDDELEFEYMGVSSSSSEEFSSSSEEPASPPPLIRKPKGYKPVRGTIDVVSPSPKRLAQAPPPAPRKESRPLKKPKKHLDFDNDDE